MLRNRAHSFVAENWARWPITGPTNEASISVITWEKTALRSRKLYMCKPEAYNLEAYYFVAMLGFFREPIKIYFLIWKLITDRRIFCASAL